MTLRASQIAHDVDGSRTGRTRLLIVASVLAMVLPLLGPLAPLAASGTTAGPEGASVAVSVATLWTTPDAPRRIDAKAVAAPADPAGWLRRLGTSGRRGLHGRVDSQVLLGQRVLVLERRGSWARVAAPEQPSPKRQHGYPGWIPLAQLTLDPPTAAENASKEAVVKRRTAWAYADQRLHVRTLKLSYGTRLPVLATTRRSVSVQAPGGRILWLSRKKVAVVAPGRPARAATGRAVAAEARKFLGLPYLWGGTSGFGLDCSGLTHLIYAQLGVTIPRDATPQFAAGKPVTRRADLRRGDLVFFRDRSGAIHHVGIYVGKGRMIHAPRTGRPVQRSSITTGLWAREFAGGRRLL